MPSSFKIAMFQKTMLRPCKHIGENSAFGMVRMRSEVPMTYVRPDVPLCIPLRDIYERLATRATRPTLSGPA
jgi:hypothetical protein